MIKMNCGAYGPDACPDKSDCQNCHHADEVYTLYTWPTGAYVIYRGPQDDRAFADAVNFEGWEYDSRPISKAEYVRRYK